MLEWLENPRRQPVASAADDGDATAFHRALPGYEPTPLIDAPELAREWEVASVRLKFERDRFGLPAFKFLGASWAVRRLLGEPPYEPGQTLVTATDGNHGRAVARVARLNGLAATIVVPEGTVAARIAAIEGEGAEVLVVDGGYDAAVRRSAELAGPGRHLVSDTSWPGYERVPRWVIEGYATIFAELDTQLEGASPDLAVIPIGVGSLAAAAARHLAGRSRLLGVEPTDAACVLESVRAGRARRARRPTGLADGRAQLRHAVAGRLARCQRRLRRPLRDRRRARGRRHAAAGGARGRGGRMLGRLRGSRRRGARRSGGSRGARDRRAEHRAACC